MHCNAANEFEAKGRTFWSNQVETGKPMPKGTSTGLAFACDGGFHVSGYHHNSYQIGFSV
jgi:hypothetical protein